MDKKTAAAGIDVDAQGNVLVCDLVNQEVVELGPDGKRLSATTVPWPDRSSPPARPGRSTWFRARSRAGPWRRANC